MDQAGRADYDVPANSGIKGKATWNKKNPQFESRGFFFINDVVLSTD